MTDIKKYKQLIQQFNQSLEQSFDNQISVLKLVKKRSQYIDRILKNIWQDVVDHDESEDSEVSDKFSIIAVGGYGREELHPYSDVDILILHESELSPLCEDRLSKYFRMLWDIGLEPGYSIRSIKECFQQAQDDVTVMTNLIESRYLFGNIDMYKRFQNEFIQRDIWPCSKFIQAKLEEQDHRHQKFDNTEENLEPNIKNSPGGLRDIQTIFWVIKRYEKSPQYTASSNTAPLISNEEMVTLKRCRSFLWKLRFGLHFLRNKKEERLLFEYQLKLAKKFGFGENQSGIEKLMKKYYRISKEVSLLNEILIQHVEEVADKDIHQNVKLSRYFNVRNQHIFINSKHVFSKHPYTILELFYLMQVHPNIIGIEANTLRLLRNHLHVIDKDFRNNEKCKRIFLDIFSYKRGQTHALRRMNTYGVLGAFIPEFGRIVGQMQHDLFHIYTVDAHTLMVVRNLRRFFIEAHKEEYEEQFEISHEVENTRILFLAGLFHDIGKGRNEDHSVVGKRITHRFCKKIGVSEYESATIVWLVRHHLLMSKIAQSEDISNPNVVLKFAQKVGDIKRLNHLYLLTVADIMGTSPKVWTRWKGLLLHKLYLSTKLMLSHDAIEPEKINERVHHIQQSVINQFDLSQSDISKYKCFWSMIDEKYFLKFSPYTLHWHASNIAHSSAADIPVVSCQYQNNIEANELIIFTADQDALMSKVTLVIDYLDFSIVNAHILRLNNGMTLLHFVITPIIGNVVINDNDLSHISQKVQQLLCLNVNKMPAIKKRRTTRRLQHFDIQEKIIFNQSDNKQFTIMTITTQDRPALLHWVCKALNDCKIALHSAKINTLGERVEDHFFITNRDQEPIIDVKSLEVIRNKVINYIHQSKEDS